MHGQKNIKLTKCVSVEFLWLTSSYFKVNFYPDEFLFYVGYIEHSSWVQAPSVSVCCHVHSGN